MKKTTHTTSPDITFVSWLKPTGKTEPTHAETRAASDRDLLDEELFLAPKMRTGNRYPRQRNYHGFYFFNQIGEHVWHESLFERDALRWIDFTYDVVAIAAQPMKITWDDGTHHFPDFLALRSDQRQVVYDVKPPGNLRQRAREQFDKTRLTCAEIGWGYEEISDQLTTTVRRNLEHLSYFAMHYFAPSERMRRLLLDAASDGEELRHAIASAGDGNSALARGNLLHMIWHRDVTFDITHPLSSNTLIRKKA